MTIQEFADKVNITRQSASHYLNGDRKPDIETLKRICIVFDVSADYLLGLSDVKMPNADIRACAEYTGLAEFIVDMLHRNKYQSIELKNEDWLEILEFILKK